MIPGTQPTAAQQLEQINQALQQSLVQRSGLHDQMDTSDKQIAALRNMLQGVELGKKIAAEEAAAAQKQEAEQAEAAEALETILE